MRRIGGFILIRRRFLELLLDPWYHDFSPLGVRTPQRDGNYRPNQRAKQEILFPLIERAIREAEDARKVADPLDVVDLFCADGFYSHYALQHGAESALGIDLDAKELQKAKMIGHLLGHRRRASFHVADVHDVQGSFEIGICAGGLYHLSDPAALLELLSGCIRRSLIVQTVYHLGVEDPEYFEAPAPGWTWGCRFSIGYLRNMLRATGWSIIDERTNELPGNDDLANRGSAYFLLAPSPFDT